MGHNHQDSLVGHQVLLQDDPGGRQVSKAKNVHLGNMGSQEDDSSIQFDSLVVEEDIARRDYHGQKGRSSSSRRIPGLIWIHQMYLEDVLA